MTSFMISFGAGGFLVSLIILALNKQHFSIESWVYLVFTGLMLLIGLTVQAVKG